MDFDSFTAPGDDAIVADIKAMIYNHYENHPRSLQEELGPSEIGEPCARRLSYRIMREPKLAKSDPLPSIVGTAAHKWLEEACNAWNVKVGRVDWIAEKELPVGVDIVGHCDAYHVPRFTVVD